MSNMILAGLLLVAATASGGAVEHHLRVDHATGAVDASYRGDVAITHKQVGAAGPGGRASTLSCAWQANVAVVRDARHPSGSSFTRSIETKSVIAGRRPGWCATQRAAIAQEVAQRTEEFRDHLIQVAQEDHSTLRAEIDRSRLLPRTG